MRCLHKFWLLGLLLSLASCGLKPIASEYAFAPFDNTLELADLGKGKVLLYNGAGILHKMDNTARLNVWINGTALGQLRPGEYVVVELPRTEINFKLEHIDAFKFRSDHKITLSENTTVIEVKPTITSNKLIVTDELPKDFEELTYMQRR